MQKKSQIKDTIKWRVHRFLIKMVKTIRRKNVLLFTRVSVVLSLILSLKKSFFFIVSSQFDVISQVNIEYIWQRRIRTIRLFLVSPYGPTRTSSNFGNVIEIFVNFLRPLQTWWYRRFQAFCRLGKTPLCRSMACNREGSWVPKPLD